MADTDILKIGLLLCDDVAPDDQPQYGTYTEMFQNSLDPDAQSIALEPIRCFEGETLPVPEQYDGYVISGSRYSVYEDRFWIKRLMQFVRDCWDQNVKMVGICFGHQLIAHALGGKTVKADAGWGFGIQSAAVTEKQPWMTNFGDLNGDHYNLVVIHQDQVLEIPPHFRAVAKNDFCPNSMIVGGNTMLGIQGHPEFSKEFCAFRAEFRKETIGQELYESTLHSLAEKDVHAGTILGWVDSFLHQANGGHP
ncbi:MAG: type 1 glutamine amidotransferase [Gammaproteobacteria bacterium]|nr:type 1 glutamine amidotransferase [Gammaproteobacteria bacterium]